MNTVYLAQKGGREDFYVGVFASKNDAIDACRRARQEDINRDDDAFIYFVYEFVVGNYAVNEDRAIWDSHGDGWE